MLDELDPNRSSLRWRELGFMLQGDTDQAIILQFDHTARQPNHTQFDQHTR